MLLLPDNRLAPDGLEPAGAFLRTRQGDVEGATNLLRYHEAAGLDVDTLADLLCIVGFTASCLASFGPCNALTIAVAWVCYLSLYRVGQTFLSFQWDILLLEVGVLAALWAPWALPGLATDLGERRRHTEKHGAAPEEIGWDDGGPLHAVRWLIRFTLFKLLFQSGVVKIQANCPSWLKLTALDYHYATQCIPTPLAWYSAPPPRVHGVCICSPRRGVSPVHLTHPSRFCVLARAVPVTCDTRARLPCL